jgi:hypothetical protein
MVSWKGGHGEAVVVGGWASRHESRSVFLDTGDNYELDRIFEMRSRFSKTKLAKDVSQALKERSAGKEGRKVQEGSIDISTCWTLSVTMTSKPWRVFDAQSERARHWRPGRYS